MRMEQKMTIDVRATEAAEGRRGKREDMSDKPVFFDASGRRAVRASVVGWTAAVVSLVLGAVFAASLVAAPQVSQLRLPGRLTAIATQLAHLRCSNEARSE